MKKAIFVAMMLLAAQFVAQEKSNITVKAAETSNGVVIITAQKVALASGQQLTEPAKRTIELQCNKEASSCIPLKAGNYTMVKLPPNHGMYDCACAQVFAATADSATTDRIGEYCLTEK